MRRKAIDLGLAYQKTRDAERAAAEANSVLEAAQHTYEERASEHLLALARSTGLLRLSPDHLEKLFGHWEEEARGAVELSLSDLKSPASAGEEPDAIDVMIRISANVGAAKKAALAAARLQWNGRRSVWSGRCSEEKIVELQGVFGDRLEILKEPEASGPDAKRGSHAETIQAESLSLPDEVAGAEPTADPANGALASEPDSDASDRMPVVDRGSPPRSEETDFSIAVRPTRPATGTLRRLGIRRSVIASSLGTPDTA